MLRSFIVLFGSNFCIGGLGLSVVDYAGLMKRTESRRGRTRYLYPFSRVA